MEAARSGGGMKRACSYRSRGKGVRWAAVCVSVGRVTTLLSVRPVYDGQDVIYPTTTTSHVCTRKVSPEVLGQEILGKVRVYVGGGGIRCALMGFKVLSYFRGMKRRKKREGKKERKKAGDRRQQAFTWFLNQTNPTAGKISLDIF